MNKKLKEKILQDYIKDEILINQMNFITESVVFILPPIVITLLISIILAYFSGDNLLILFLIFYSQTFIPLSFLMVFILCHSDIKLYLCRRYIKKRMIADIKYWDKNYRIYDGIYATRNWEIKCIDVDDFRCIEIDESINFSYQIIIDDHSLSITGKQYETLRKIQKEYNDKYDQCNPLLLLTCEQFEALQNNSIFNVEFSIA